MSSSDGDTNEASQRNDEAV